MTTTLLHRPAQERGHANYGWLDTWHSFSFADYHDPAHDGWGPLLVINDDTVAPGRGFATHGHRDMEIISVVLSGALAHKDSMGHGTSIRPGEVQRMSAGTGVRHSEFNPQADTPTRFLQIWIRPERSGSAPSYEQTAFDPAQRQDRWQLLASPDGREGSVTIQQDATLSAIDLTTATPQIRSVKAGRKGYAHLISGELQLNHLTLSAGDGVKIEGPCELTLTTHTGKADAPAALLWFDLPDHQ